MKLVVEKLTSMHEVTTRAITRIKLAQAEKNLAELESQMAQADFWHDAQKAEQVSKASAALKRYIASWRQLESDISSLLSLAKLSDDAQVSEFEQQLVGLTHRFEAQMVELKLSGEFDDRAAIMQISAGVGGTDAQDWAQMLLAMYSKYCEKNNLAAELVDVSYGEEAGIKSATLEITGRFAYGKLKGEKGVHRLVRLSPFNAQHLRQTSFALVDVIPEIADQAEELSDKDLRIDTFRASGHGGQSVNTTDSAVRITHLPTGLTVSIQNERSQLKNKQKALSILASRLAQLAREQKLANIADIRGKLKSADWGSQIRSYVLQPYTKVKDHRTGVETSDVNAVLDGEIEDFIEAYLNYSLKK